MIRPIEGSLGGKVAVVTGASAGIGKEIARDLLTLGAEVIAVGRNPERSRAVADELVASTKSRALSIELCDLSSQAAVRRLADRLGNRPRIDVLINNAGVTAAERTETVDGIELVWATNQLAYALLTELLLPRIPDGGRIVNVASMMAYGLDLDDVEFRKRRYDVGASYAQSKQANRMWSWALDRRMQARAISVNVMHPGPVETPLLAALAPGMRGRTTAHGADTASWLAAAPLEEIGSGGFFQDRKRVACRFHDVEQEEALWRLCERMTKR